MILNEQSEVASHVDFSVLDMGCGIGGSAFFLAKEIKNVDSVLGVDISENMLNVSLSACRIGIVGWKKNLNITTLPDCSSAP